MLFVMNSRMRGFNKKNYLCLNKGKNNYMRFIFFIVSVLFLLSLQAQQRPEITRHKVENLLAKKAECQQKKKKASFYYIQIYNGKDINKAKMILKDFISKYPNSKAFVTWENPEYKVWTGEYYTKFEVERAMQLLKEEYPDALIVYPKIRN